MVFRGRSVALKARGEFSGTAVPMFNVVMFTVSRALPLFRGITMYGGMGATYAREGGRLNRKRSAVREKATRADDVSRRQRMSRSMTGGKLHGINTEDCL